MRPCNHNYNVTFPCSPNILVSLVLEEIMALLVGFGVLQHTMRKTSFKTRQARNI